MSEFPALCTMQIFQMVNQYFKLHYDEFSKCRIKIRYNDRGTFNAAELLAQALMNSNFANENIHFAKFDTISIRHFAVSDVLPHHCRYIQGCRSAAFYTDPDLTFHLQYITPNPDPKNVGNMFLIL